MLDQPLSATPLHDVHEQLGATFTDFAGWQMPVRYTSDLAEHGAVRESAGIFDLSHMGEIHLRGAGAADALDHAFAGRFSAMSIGRAKYSLMLTADGLGVVDDVIVYRLGEEHFLVVANAGNAVEVSREISERATGFEVRVEDASADTALIAVQGPASAGIITRALTGDAGGAEGITGEDLDSLKYYRVLQGTYEGEVLLVARTGYTGEDGFELYVPAARAASLWDHLRTVGGAELVPCGLASRDTLRLEAGMPLYGHELNRDILPEQSGLGRVVALSSQGDFVGRAGLESADREGRRVLVGLVAEGRRAARAGSALKDASGSVIGEVTSGVLSPTLGHPIAMAFVAPEHSEVGAELVIDVRGKDLPATVTAMPFYSRS